MRIINATKEIELAGKARLADCFLMRLKGLLGTKNLPKGEALIIKPCSSVHTIGMSYAIDVLFVSEQNIVLKVVKNLPPWRAAACRGSAYVVELPAGTGDATGAACGHLLSFSS